MDFELTHAKTHDDLVAVQAKIEEYRQLIPSLPFDADGVVVKIDRLALHDELGIVGGRERHLHDGQRTHAVLA